MNKPDSMDHQIQKQAERIAELEAALRRIREILTDEVLSELGSEQHEILIPQYSDEVREILIKEVSGE